ncbi:hypothetical protein C3L33_02831, partial [Rhododendron williamsianum]
MFPIFLDFFLFNCINGVILSSLAIIRFCDFSYLIASMGLQFLWSFGLACLDIHALRLKKDLHSHVLVSLFVVGDWVTSVLSLAAACSATGVVILLSRDTNFCRVEKQLACSTFKISVALAFVSWFLLAISSFVMFWLLASV